MAAVYACEVGDLEYKHNNIKKSVVETRTIKASAVKSVLLAYADHANEEGRATYPAITTLEKKTELSRQTIVNAQKALKQNGFLVVMGISHRGTKEYSINLEKVQESTELTSKSQSSGLPPVNGVASNRPLTVPKPSFSAQKPAREPATVEEAIIYGGKIPEDQLGEEAQFKADVDEACFLICQNNLHLEPLARAFMESRKIILNPKKRSGHLKALNEMYDAKPKRVQPKHIHKAVEDAKEDPKIYNKIVDLFGIVKMSIGAANAMQEKNPINNLPAYQKYQPEEIKGVPNPNRRE